MRLPFTTATSGPPLGKVQYLFGLPARVTSVSVLYCFVFLYSLSCNQSFMQYAYYHRDRSSGYHLFMSLRFSGSGKQNVGIFVPTWYVQQLLIGYWITTVHVFTVQYIMYYLYRLSCNQYFMQYAYYHRIGQADTTCSCVYGSVVQANKMSGFLCLCGMFSNSWIGYWITAVHVFTVQYIMYECIVFCVTMRYVFTTHRQE